MKKVGMHTISLYDLAGNLLSVQQIAADHHSLSIGQYARGVYMVVIDNVDGQTVVKVVL